MLALSVLDQSPIPRGASAADAVRETLRLAQAAERLGYRRYWLAEHHNTSALAGSTPEILIARVAGVTSSIRVGSGGVMLSHYSPLKVAENFRMLETLYPGRIDLGIGRAPGSDPLTAAALKHGPGALDIEHFPEQIADLVGYLHDGLEPGHPFAAVRAMPMAAQAPELWLLGSSGYSAAYAAHFGLAFSFAHFINPQDGPLIMDGYRQRFRPSDLLSEPLGNIGVSVICAETTEDAERLASSIRLWRLRLERGDPGPVPSIEEAEQYPYTEIERRRIALSLNRSIVGDPIRVRDELCELAEAYRVNEVVVVTICHDPEARLRSYELLADAFQLQPPAPQEQACP
jgi:luciferase family oxidoreductase group 1